MRVEDFDYTLPPERIAQEPCRPRDAARLLVDRLDDAPPEHRRARDLPELLAPGDLLVMNDTRVIPARLHARRASGGAVELLLTQPVEGSVWRALVNPARKLHPGEELTLERGAGRVRMRTRPVAPDGRPALEWTVELLPAGEEPGAVEALLERAGRMPLPPYVERAPDDPRAAADREDYQTVYAQRPGAIAAPTAGLHFTPELLAALAERGVETAFLTLHVGIGTFRPVKAERVEQHEMHAERFELSAATVAAIEAARARGGRVVAVGTTVVRVLEACVGPDGTLQPGAGETALFIVPGHRFRAVDALLTNFHLPRSTLLMLVSAFAGRERVLALYAEALRAGYRFYSFGDAMLLLPAGPRRAGRPRPGGPAGARARTG